MAATATVLTMPLDKDNNLLIIIISQFRFGLLVEKVDTSYLKGCL